MLWEKQRDDGHGLPFGGSGKQPICAAPRPTASGWLRSLRICGAAKLSPLALFPAAIHPDMGNGDRRLGRVDHRADVDRLVHPLGIFGGLVGKAGVGAEILVIPRLQSFQPQPVDLARGFGRHEDTCAPFISADFIAGMTIGRRLIAGQTDLDPGHRKGVLPEGKAFDRVRRRICGQTGAHRLLGGVAQSHAGQQRQRQGNRGVGKYLAGCPLSIFHDPDTRGGPIGSRASWIFR